MELLIVIAFCMLFAALVAGAWSVLSGSQGSAKSPEVRQAEALERIAKAEESQAKSLDAIARWVWEPDPEEKDKLLEKAISR